MAGLHFAAHFAIGAHFVMAGLQGAGAVWALAEAIGKAMVAAVRRARVVNLPVHTIVVPFT